MAATYHDHTRRLVRNVMAARPEGSMAALRRVLRRRETAGE
jgi:hypothetical protein